MNRDPNDPIVHIEREIPRIESMALAIFNRNGPSMDFFMGSQPPADLDMYSLDDLVCIFVRVGTKESYVNWLAANADVFLDTLGFAVRRYVPEAMANCRAMPQFSNPSYELLVESLQQDKELEAVLPLPTHHFQDALERMVEVEHNLRTRLITLGVLPEAPSARIDQRLLGSEIRQVNDAWSFAIRLDKNIRSLKAQLQVTESTHRNNKLIHLAKIAEQY